MTTLDNAKINLLSHMIVGKEELNSKGFSSRDDEGINLFFSLLDIDYIECYDNNYYSTIDTFESTKKTLRKVNEDDKILQVIEKLKNPKTEEFIERHFGEWWKTQVFPNSLTKVFKELDEQIQKQNNTYKKAEMLKR
jgi:hypothetical protein